MNTIELIQESKAVADLAWDAVKVSDPHHFGMYLRHADTSEGDHNYARALLSGSTRSREHNELTIAAASDLVNFLEHRIGWGNPDLLPQGSMWCRDRELVIAAMMQYQDRIIHTQQMGVAGARAEAGLERMLRDMVDTYGTMAGDAVANSNKIIHNIREKLDPLFEDGLRLSEHKKIREEPKPDIPADRVQKLAQQLNQPASSASPRTDDPWGGPK